MSNLNNNFLEEVKLNLEQMKIPDFAPIIVGVSGGADSISLLYALHLLGFQVTCVHINYGLRGDESEADSNFVEQFTNNHGINFQLYKVQEEAPKSGVQDWARAIRYQVFETLRIETKSHAIAVGHHADDQLEQMLWKFIRGGKIHDLIGMKLKNRKIIRPLLTIPKETILEFLSDSNIQFRSDSTNQKNDYARNQLRNVIIPELEKLSPGLRSNSQKVRNNLLVSEFFYKQNKQTLVKKITKHTENSILFYENAMQKYPQTVVKTICSDVLSEYGFTLLQSNEIFQLEERGTFISNADWRVIKVDSGWKLCSAQSDVHIDCTFPLEIGEYQPQSNIRVIISNENIDGAIQIPKSLIGENLLLRRKKDGDYVFGKDGKKRKLKKLFNDQKLELDERESVICVCLGEQIIWVPGVIQNSKFLPKPGEEYWFLSIQKVI